MFPQSKTVLFGATWHSSVRIIDQLCKVVLRAKSMRLRSLVMDSLIVCTYRLEALTRLAGKFLRFSSLFTPPQPLHGRFLSAASVSAFARLFPVSRAFKTSSNWASRLSSAAMASAARCLWSSMISSIHDFGLMRPARSMRTKTDRTPLTPRSTNCPRSASSKRPPPVTVRGRP